jgi:Protein of unknown function (DUF5818)
MKNTKFAVLNILPTMALTVAMCFGTQPMFAQNMAQTPDPSNPSAAAPSTTTQQQPMQPDDQTANVAKTFHGKIVQAGDKLVLTATDKTYQLDDQQKAQDFLNKSVKITGVLDASTGTIRISAIEPA